MAALLASQTVTCTKGNQMTLFKHVYSIVFGILFLKLGLRIIVIIIFIYFFTFLVKTFFQARSVVPGETFGDCFAVEFSWG